MALEAAKMGCEGRHCPSRDKGDNRNTHPVPGSGSPETLPILATTNSMVFISYIRRCDGWQAEASSFWTKQKCAHGAQTMRHNYARKNTMRYPKSAAMKENQAVLLRGKNDDAKAVRWQWSMLRKIERYNAKAAH